MDDLRHLKPRNGMTQRVTTPPGKAGQQPEAESCVGRGDPFCETGGASERIGRVMGASKIMIAGTDVVVSTEGRTGGPRAWPMVPPGSRAGHVRGGPQEPGGPIPPKNVVGDATTQTTLAWTGHRPDQERVARMQKAVPAYTEARGYGRDRLKSGAAHVARRQR